LLRAAKNEQEVDLSQFPDLSMDDFVSLTSKLSNKTTSLSLSGPNVTAAFLVLDLLAVNTSLRKIYVLDAPNLQLQSALRLMYQPGSPWIYHSDMFRNPVRIRPCQTAIVDEMRMIGILINLIRTRSYISLEEESNSQ
jgi:hypothetical protein